MWPFILTRTLTLEKPIVAAKSDVLNILHNPKLVLDNNDMAVSVVQDDSDPSLYTVTDRLPLIGSWTTHTTIKSRWTKTTDGCDVEVYANLWTRLFNELRVRELDSAEGTVLYYERVVVKVQSESLSNLLVNVHSFSGIVFVYALHYVHHHQRSHWRSERTCCKIEEYVLEQLLWTFILTTILLKKIKRIKMPSSYFSLFLTLLGALYTGYLVKNSFYLTCFGFLFAVAFWLYIQRRHNDPYGLFHLSLNKLPFEDPISLPETEWLNLGYWKVFSDRISMSCFSSRNGFE